VVVYVDKRRCVEGLRRVVFVGGVGALHGGSLVFGGNSSRAGVFYGHNACGDRRRERPRKPQTSYLCAFILPGTDNETHRVRRLRYIMTG
jgi:hypothetical protein